MSENPNKMIKFWQELKRRKVFKVIAMYAGTAFIILQLFDIIAQPLQWPAWTMTFVIVLLCIGFIITLLISWIYDITPEGIKKTESIEAVRKKKSQPVTERRRIKASDIIIAAMAIAIVILLYPKIFKRDTLEKLRSSGERISVAVMPFLNMTGDTVWNVWQDGIQEIITSSLSASEELSIRQTETIKNLVRSSGLNNYASLTPYIASRISQKLNADLFICGKIIQSGKTIRVYAQLVESKSKEVFKPFQIEGTQENILTILDSLALNVKNFLIISKLRNEAHLGTYASTISPEAYRCYIYGLNASDEGNRERATEWYLKALEIDTNFFEAALSLPYEYSFRGLYEDAKRWCFRFYKKRDLMPERLRLTADLNYAYYFGTPYEEIEYDKQRLRLDNQSPSFHYSLAFDYIRLYQYSKAIPEYKKSLELYKNIGLKPPTSYYLTSLGYAYHNTGQYKKEKRLYKKAEKDFPDNPDLISSQATLSLSKGDIIRANKFIEKYMSILKGQSFSEANIISNLGDIYFEAEIWDKAEEYYRDALLLQPENPERMNHLAYFLIDKDRNINEGMALIDKALELSPDIWYMLDTKGWGLYKQGKFKEASDFLQKAYSLKPIYNHELYLHLEAAKKAVTNQKNN